MTPDTHLVSFVLRFVCDAPEHPAALWHGWIRHIQSDEELHFTSWSDAMAFLEQYVNVSDERQVKHE